MNKLDLNSQKGFSPIHIIIGGIVVLVIIAAVMYLLPKKSKENTANQIDASKINFDKCKSKDYGGCDEEKNFYKWKDDGLP